MFTEGPDGWWFCGVKSVIEGNTAIPGQSGTYRFHVRPATASTGNYQGDDSAPAIYIIHPQVSEDSNLPRPPSSQLSQTIRYVPTYNGAITIPTTVKNLSSSSHTGTLNGGAFVDTTGGHLDLDGSASQKLEFGSTDWGGTFSVEMWIKTRETAQTTIAELVATATNHIGSDVGFRITRSGNLSNEIRFGFRGNVNFDPGFTFTNNQWEHYVITFNDADPETGSNYTSYKNGSSGTIADAGNTVLAGQQTTNELSGHDMEIGEFRIYDKVLTLSLIHISEPTRPY